MDNEEQEGWGPVDVAIAVICGLFLLMLILQVGRR